MPNKSKNHSPSNLCPAVTRFPVLMNTQSAAARLVDAASRCGFDVLVRSGRYCVSAKSMLGVLSLDITKPCWVVSDDDLSALRSAVADMVCEAPCKDFPHETN